MPKFDSDIGGRSFQGQPMRELDVQDETGYSEPVRKTNRLGGVSVAGAIEMDEQSIREFQARMAAQSQMHNDLHNPDAELEREMRAAKEAKRTGKERLNDGAKRRIEMLLGMTRTLREVDIEGNVFVLRTLKGDEMRQAIASASAYDGTVQSPYEVRKQLLARSLTQVAGVDINQFIGGNSLEHRFLFVDELDEALLSRLYDEYVILAKEARSKYAIKTEEEVKEIVEDLKK